MWVSSSVLRPLASCLGEAATLAGPKQVECDLSTLSLPLSPSPGSGGVGLGAQLQPSSLTV